MDAPQFALVIDDVHGALAEIVRALGGAEKVGRQLWPEKTAAAAAQGVRDCLNPERRERFNPEQVLLLFRMARLAGFHGAMHWFSDFCGYSHPEPIEPDDEHARLMREFVQASNKLEQLGARIERMMQPAAVAVPARGGRR